MAQQAPWVGMICLWNSDHRMVGGSQLGAGPFPAIVVAGEPANPRVSLCVFSDQGNVFVPGVSESTAPNSWSELNV
jgi:hypothetical protein